MTRSRAIATASRERLRRSAASGAALLLLLASAWTGCSAQTRYEFLSFFFDGVPDPNAPIDPETALSSGALLRARSVHPPFKDKQCSSCHEDPSRTRLNRESSQVCFSCHEGVDEQYAFMHGPVVARACMWCHNPHFASTDHLLRQSPPDLCRQCHGEAQLNIRRADGRLLRPEHEDLSRNCLDCHHGHGSAEPGLLRAHEPVINASTSKDDVSL